MRHRKAGYKLGRTTAHRKAMLRNMVTSLFEYEQIRTTEAKAKAAKPLAEKMITLAKKGDLHAQRLALAVLTKKSVTHKLFTEIKDRYMERAGGYTSLVRIGPRRGDAAEMVVLALVKAEEKAKAKKRPRRRRGARKKAATEAEPKAQKEAAATEPEPEVKAEAPAEPEAPETEVEETAPADTADEGGSESDDKAE